MVIYESCQHIQKILEAVVFSELVRAAERVFKLDVDLRPVEGAAYKTLGM